MSDRLGKMFFLLSLTFFIALLAFAYGIGVGWGRVWPAGPLRTIYAHLQSLYVHGEWQPSGRLVRAPAGASRERVVIHKPQLFEPGYRAIMGWSGEGYAVWLFDQHGHQVHSWKIDYEALDPDGPSRDSDEPHGMKLLADGSILLNFDRGDVLARLDVCGRPIWVKQGVYHHSIDRAEDGTFWTWRADYSAYGQYQYLVNFDPETGQTLQELSLIEDFIERSPDQRQIFALTDGYAYVRDGGDDLFHPNDIEVLASREADNFPMLNPGDLLVSFRNIHLVAILDPVSKIIKWWSHGPWRFQHDPDFMSDGRILVYNNNTDRGHSSVIAIDAQSRQLNVAFADQTLNFYSAWAGKLQQLPGGAIHLTVPDEGRVLEASWAGDLIFEFNNVLSDRVNGYVVNSIWLPNDFFEEEPRCRAGDQERPTGERSASGLRGMFQAAHKLGLVDRSLLFRSRRSDPLSEDRTLARGSRDVHPPPFF